MLTWRRDPAPDRLLAAESAPIEATLLETASGTIRWSCWMPRGRARSSGAMRCTRARLRRDARLTIPPSRLPFRTLRWGAASAIATLPV
jgi:hypothetical protein